MLGEHSVEELHRGCDVRAVVLDVETDRLTAQAAVRVGVSLEDAQGLGHGAPDDRPGTGQRENHRYDVRLGGRAGRRGGGEGDGGRQHGGEAISKRHGAPIVDPDCGHSC